MLQRSTVVGAAAWAAPAIAASIASPAYAASQEVTLSLDVPATAELGMLAPEAVYATVLVNGSPAAGVTVTFTVIDPSLAGFGADGAESVVTAVTDGAGIARPPVMLLKAPGSVAVSAAASGRSTSAFITVSEVPASGTIAFKQAAVNVAAASTFALAGALTRTAGAGYPAQVTIAYPAGYSGPATVPVDQATGEFVVPNVTAGAADASISASAPKFGTATVAITLVLGYISTTQAVYAAGKGLAAPRGSYVITGTVTRVAPGAALPATVTINWKNRGGDYENVTGFTNGETVPVDQATAVFTLPTLLPIDTGPASWAGGGIVISALGYQSIEIKLYNLPAASYVDGYNSMSTTPALTVFAPGETRDVPGKEVNWNGLYEVVYPEGFTGPATVTSDGNGYYTIRGVTAPDYITSGEVLVRVSGSGGYNSRGLFGVL